MIPKKVHYCWLSGEEMPSLIRKCIQTWKKRLPDYEFICWDNTKFDIQSKIFVKEACQVKKWAFAADYIRLYALYNEGGIYLDSDVIVNKKFDDFLNSDFFTSVEYHPLIIERENSLELLNEDGSKKNSDSVIIGIGIQAAVMGSVPGHPFLMKCLDFYENRHFILENGELYNKIIAPTIYAEVAEDFGYKYKDEKQVLRNNMLILTSDIFVGSGTYDQKNSYAVHLNNGSWRDKTKKNVFIRAINKCCLVFHKKQ